MRYYTMKTSTTLVTMTMTMLLLALALPAGAADYTLGIFGNANEDDTINMQDVTYTELIILEYRDKTELSDAKHDGKINMQDVTQIELTILGKDKELTLLDSTDRVVTVQKPVESIVSVSHGVGSAMVVKALEADDKVIGIPEHMKDMTTFFPEMSKLPSVGTWDYPDYEKILEFDPDIVLATYISPEDVEEKLEPEITVISLNCGGPLRYTQDVKKLGYILGKKDRADEYIDWYKSYVDTIVGKVEGLSDDDKPRVFDFYGGEWGMSEGPPYGTSGRENFIVLPLIEMAGGINIASDLPGDWITVDAEWVITQNPDVIIREIFPEVSGPIVGYDTDDPLEVIAMREDIMNQPAFELTDAVKEGDVYLCYGSFIERDWFIGLTYMAKWFHPELFEDLNPQEFHQEFLSEFQRLDYDLTERGVFVYPES